MGWLVGVVNTKKFFNAKQFWIVLWSSTPAAFKTLKLLKQSARIFLFEQLLWDGWGGRDGWGGWVGWGSWGV